MDIKEAIAVETVHTHTHTHTSNLKNKGITLITLVITIIILLILAGITIVGLTGSGLFGKAEIAKQKMRYASAKEAVNLKLMEIQAECIENKEDYNIKKIAEGMKLAEDITIEKYYNKGTGSIKDGVTENLTDLEGIVVSVDEYSEYKFLIGEKSQLKGVLEGEVSDTTKIEEFVNIEEFEEKTFGNKVATDNIEYSYEKKIVDANKIQILIIIKDEENGLNKIVYPDGDILNCNGKNEVGIDYTIERGVEYVFKITSNNGYVKEVRICEEIITIKYLYKNGDKCEEITEGWCMAADRYASADIDNYNYFDLTSQCRDREYGNNIYK